MLYTMADVEARAGVSSRTIREYISLGYLLPPEKKGAGALYTEEQLLAAVCVARMRAQKVPWDEIADKIPAWSVQRMRAYVKKTDPPAPKVDHPAAPPPAPAAPPALEGEPVDARKQLPGSAGASPGRAWVTRPDDDAELPDAPRWMLVQLLPGMALMVRDDAARVVKRAAAEIIERYGTLG